MVNSLSPKWLSVYLNAGLACDVPILEAVCLCPSFNPRSIKEIGDELLGDRDLYPSLEKVKVAFMRGGVALHRSGFKAHPVRLSIGLSAIIKKF